MAEGDEKTLLRFEGDASGVQRAAAEAVQSIQAVQEANQRAQQAIVAAGARPANVADLLGGRSQADLNEEARQIAQIAEMQRAAAARPVFNPQETMLGLGPPGTGPGPLTAGPGIAVNAQEAMLGLGPMTAAVETLGSRTEGASQYLARLALRMAGLNPHAIMATEAITRLGGGLSKLAPVAGIVAGIGFAFKAVNDAVGEAVGKLQEFSRLSQHIQQRRMTVQGTVGEQLAALGKGSEGALQKATAVAQRLETKGLPATAAGQVAAFFTSETGKQTISEEDMELVTAGVAHGDIELGGTTERERGRSQRQALKTLARKRESLAKSRAMYGLIRQQKTEGAAAGRVPAAAQVLVEELGINPEEAHARAESVKTLQEYGAEKLAGGFPDETPWVEAKQDISGALHAIPGVGPLLDIGEQSARQERIERAQKDLEVIKRVQSRAEAGGKRPTGARGTGTRPTIMSPPPPPPPPPPPSAEAPVIYERGWDKPTEPEFPYGGGVTPEGRNKAEVRAELFEKRLTAADREVEAKAAAAAKRSAPAPTTTVNNYNYGTVTVRPRGGFERIQRARNPM